MPTCMTNRGGKPSKVVGFAATACLLVLLVATVAAAVVGYLSLHPMPLKCYVELVRPNKFKIDVTEFFTPRVSVAVQAVLSISNGNPFRSMLLESCKVVALDAVTGLKLGSALQGPLVVSPYSKTQVTLHMRDVGGATSPEEQRKMATTFLYNKALLLGFVATATSRLPLKDSKLSKTSTEVSNATRKVDFSAMYKEPFFQRAAPPPTEEVSVHDVPL